MNYEGCLEAAPPAHWVAPNSFAGAVELLPPPEGIHVADDLHSRPCGCRCCRRRCHSVIYCL